MRGFIACLVDYLAPCSCVACGRDLPPLDPACGPRVEGLAWRPEEAEAEPVPGVRAAARILCPDCWETIERAPGEGRLGSGEGAGARTAVVAPFRTGDALLAAIRFLKFSGGRSAAAPLGRWMAMAMRERLSLPGAPPVGETELLPTPLHPRRLAERGYNQALLLAREVAWRTGARLSAAALERVRNTRSQSTLEEGERAANVRGAFLLRDVEMVNHRHIILIDDLVTTGETARACIEALAPGEPASVTVLAAGRVRD